MAVYDVATKIVVQGVDTASLNRAISTINGQMDRGTAKAKSFSDAIALRGVNLAGYAAIGGAMVKITESISRATNDAIRFEYELAKIAQTVDKSNAEIKTHAASIRDISVAYGLSAPKIAETVRVLAQAGYTFKQAKAAADSLAQTTLLASFESIADTTDGLIAINKQFTSTMGDSARVLSILNSVSKKYAVESSDLVEAVRKAGGVFAATGGTMEELVSIFTTVRDTTRESAETIATGLRTIFSRLQRPKTIDYLRQFGIELTDLKGNFVGNYEAIQRVQAGLEKAGVKAGSIKFSEVVEEVGGIRQQARVIPLLTQGAKLQKVYADAMGASKDTAEDLAKAQDTLSFKLSQTQQNFSKLVGDIINTESFQKIADIFLSLANATIRFADSLKELIPLIGLVVGAKLGASFAKVLSKSPAAAILGGGSVKKFARGGFVPGSGSGDTVPAMLEPGEFVIRKSAAEAMGAEALHGINKYATGGKSKKGKKPVKVVQSKQSYGMLVAKQGNPEDMKGSFLDSKSRTRYVADIKVSGFKKSKTFNDQVKSIQDRVNNVGKELAETIGKDKLIDQSSVISKLGTATGQLFENYVLTAAGKKSPKNNTFDIERSNSKLKELTSQSVVGLTDIKKTYNQQNANDVARKAVNYWKKDITKFASGGSVGTDTVPAMLTPGEFVINKKSAQAFGYGNLREVNRYAKGGTVSGIQKFNIGGVADQDVVRGQGDVIKDLEHAGKIFSESLESLGPELKAKVLKGFKGIEEVKAGQTPSLIESKVASSFKGGTRGRASINDAGDSSIGLQIGGNVSATEETVKHEAGHLVDVALGSTTGKAGPGKMLASQQEGTFQFDLVEKVKPQMEAAMIAAGHSTESIQAYLLKNEELFAEFFAKATPEVRKIITSTTDSAQGMAELQAHLEKAGHTYAGLEASDIKILEAPNSDAARARRDSQYEADNIAIQALNSPPSRTNPVVPLNQSILEEQNNVKKIQTQREEVLTRPGNTGDASKELAKLSKAEAEATAKIQELNNQRSEVIAALKQEKINILKGDSRQTGTPSSFKEVIPPAPDSPVDRKVIEQQWAKTEAESQRVANLGGFPDLKSGKSSGGLLGGGGCIDKSPSDRKKSICQGKKDLETKKSNKAEKESEAAAAAQNATSRFAFLAVAASGVASQYTNQETVMGRATSSVLELVQGFSLVQGILGEFGQSLDPKSVLEFGKNLLDFKGAGKGKIAEQITGKIGNVGKNIGNLGKGVASVGAGIGGTTGKVLAGAGGGIAKAGTAVTANAAALAGPASIAAGALVAGAAVYGFGKALDSIRGLEEKAAEAIKEGNIAEAGKTAVTAQAQADLTKFSAAIATGLSAIPLVGPLIGGLVGGLIKLGGSLPGVESLLTGARNLGAAFGLLESTASIAAKAQLEAAIVAQEANREKSRKAVGQLAEGIKDEKSANEFLGSGLLKDRQTKYNDTKRASDRVIEEAKTRLSGSENDKAFSAKGWGKSVATLGLSNLDNASRWWNDSDKNDKKLIEDKKAQTKGQAAADYSDFEKGIEFKLAEFAKTGGDDWTGFMEDLTNTGGEYTRTMIEASDNTQKLQIKLKQLADAAAIERTQRLLTANLLSKTAPALLQLTAAITKAKKINEVGDVISSVSSDNFRGDGLVRGAKSDNLKDQTRVAKTLGINDYDLIAGPAVEARSKLQEAEKKASQSSDLVGAQKDLTKTKREILESFEIDPTIDISKLEGKELDEAIAEATKAGLDVQEKLIQAAESAQAGMNKYIDSIDRQEAARTAYTQAQIDSSQMVESRLKEVESFKVGGSTVKEIRGRQNRARRDITPEASAERRQNLTVTNAKAIAASDKIVNANVNDQGSMEAATSLENSYSALQIQQRSQTELIKQDTQVRQKLIDALKEELALEGSRAKSIEDFNVALSGAAGSAAKQEAEKVGSVVKRIQERLALGDVEGANKIQGQAVDSGVASVAQIQALVQSQEAERLNTSASQKGAVVGERKFGGALGDDQISVSGLNDTQDKSTRGLTVRGAQLSSEASANFTEQNKNDNTLLLIQGENLASLERSTTAFKESLGTMGGHFKTFGDDLKTVVASLKDASIKMTLDSSRVIVDINSGEGLKQLSSEMQKQVSQMISDRFLKQAHGEEN